MSCTTRRRFASWSRGLFRVILALALAFIATACGGIDENAALVTRVIDGDTIEIEGGIRVRYIGIDTPETDQPYYLEAREANRNLVNGRHVRLEKDVEDKDKYGRLLRYVWVGDVMVNAELVSSGYAYSYSYPPNLKYQAQFLLLEKEAREHKRGLWSD